MAKSISVIIPNFNGKNLLDMILPTVYASLKKAGVPYEIILADDASTDDSIAFIQQKYPDIICIQNSRNEGFSVSVNNGATAAKYDLLFFLNNDVKLTEDYFVSLLYYFDKPDTFGVNGRVIGWEDDKIQDAAKLPYFQGAKLKTSRNYYYKENTPAEVFTFYLTGSNALIDRKKFFQMGGFNEIFSPFYCEDLELSVRAWKAGWKCYYEHHAICRHKVSATTSALKKKKFVDIIYNRNKFIFHYLHLSGFGFLQYLIQIISESIGKLLILNFVYLQSLIGFLKKLRSLKKIKKNTASYLLKYNLRQIVDLIDQQNREKEIVIFKN